MLIGEFSRRTGLGISTIRFYIRKGLLAPEAGQSGGRNPYAQFTERDAQIAAMIRFSQSLGMSLKEISSVKDEMQQAGISRERTVELMDLQLQAIELKAKDLSVMADYLRTKRDWIAAGKPGDEPSMACNALSR